MYGGSMIPMAASRAIASAVEKPRVGSAATRMGNERCVGTIEDE